MGSLMENRVPTTHYVMFIVWAFAAVAILARLDSLEHRLIQAGVIAEDVEEMEGRQDE